ncbi:MAG: SWIM zinc finger family protein [Desulfovibrio sp.]|nr:SWIM zinc finger family protein [Desulfovibrio sp.]
MPYGFPAYISVQEKIRNAEKMLAKLHAKGMQPQPVAAFTGALAKTFWGKSWCANLEHYADFANRLPRGRDYVRHGCVCHLEIGAGEVRAKVLGSRLYDVTVRIAPLPARRWQTLCAGCAGQIATLIDLLRGRLSSESMTVICDPTTGMFPSPKEIRFFCSCPDSARMCKHVAAALYGVGRRLDAAPEELFTLRGVNAADLLPPALDIAPAPMPNMLQVEDMGALFGIDLQTDVPRPGEPSGQAAPDKALPSSGTANSPTKPHGLVKADHPTGTAIRNLHRLSKLDASAFAEALGVTLPTLKRWEGTRGALRLKADSVLALMRFQTELLQNLMR